MPYPADTITIREIIAALDRIAPPHLALDNDPTGLLIGDRAAAVSAAVVALDVTMAAVEEAKRQRAGLIVAHHPLIYHPLKTILAEHAHPGAVILECVRAEIAVACAHTCWDVAPGGVNDVLAALCGLTAVRPLKITYREPLVKIVVFVPTEQRETVFSAMADAGAGAIGEYDRCGFWTEGTGTFRPLTGAEPFLGTVGEAETVLENRLEMIAPESRWRSVVAAMKKAHPYEEVAHEVYPLKNTAAEYGIGRIGTLPEPESASAFLDRVKTALNFPEVRMVGQQDRVVRTVAVCGGAGAFLMGEAIRAGADALVTSDVRHHEFVEAEARGFLLLDAGHAATETPGTRELANRLAAVLPETVTVTAL